MQSPVGHGCPFRIVFAVRNIETSQYHFRNGNPILNGSRSSSMLSRQEGYRMSPRSSGYAACPSQNPQDSDQTTWSFKFVSGGHKKRSPGSPKYSKCESGCISELEREQDDLWSLLT